MADPGLAPLSHRIAAAIEQPALPDRKPIRRLCAAMPHIMMTSPG
jgi:hypothetical protein